MLNTNNDISDLEIDLMLLFYTFSDQYGNVNMFACQKWAKERLGIIIKNTPFKLTQKHIDVLVARNVLPDAYKALIEIRDNPPQNKK